MVPAEGLAQSYCTCANTLKGINMLKKTIVAGLVAGAFAPTFASAADSPHSLSGNMGIYSQYIFRGVSQTDFDPALQGGFDYSHASGLYAGTWLSNVSWTSPGYTGGGSLEADFYGGYRGSVGDFGYDLGLLQYHYPGTPIPGGFKADALEAYGAVSWKWLSLKYSHVVSNKAFGVPDAEGTYYVDLTATVPINDKLSVVAHYGIQKFNGDFAPGVSNDSIASFKDYKIGLSYALPKDFTIGAFFTGTDMDATAKPWYTGRTGKFWGKDTGTVFISKTF